MFFRKNKLLAILTVIGGFLGCEVSFADPKEANQTAINQLQETKQPETKIVGRDENKTTNYT